MKEDKIRNIYSVMMNEYRNYDWNEKGCKIELGWKRIRKHNRLHTQKFFKKRRRRNKRLFFLLKSNIC
jgi:hypothetical protein